MGDGTIHENELEDKCFVLEPSRETILSVLPTSLCVSFLSFFFCGNLTCLLDLHTINLLHEVCRQALL